MMQIRHILLCNVINNSFLLIGISDKDSDYSTEPLLIIFFMSHSLLWRHIVLLTVGVYTSSHRVLYTIGISMTRRFQKSVGSSVRTSVRLSVHFSVCPFVTLTKKSILLLHYDSRKIIRVSGERAYHPLQENEAILKKKIFKILDQIFENFCTCIKCLLFFHYKQWNNNIVRISDERAWHPLQENDAVFSKTYFRMLI